MKTRYLLLLFLLCAPGLFAQEPKGVVPVSALSAVGRRPSTVTRAVVVGISDYQSPDIPDLRFADRDAEAFVAWLKSPAGGSVPAENIRLDTNEAATNARFAGDLDWLMETSKEGEQAIIFFSGHGDVETKTLNQLGFLLLYDSPAHCYKAGAYSLVYLQDIISTLSIQNKVRVMAITDACHAGKLAGTSVNGTQVTAYNLAKLFANEVKIMSCQPNEFSIESEQWGGGRGVFSYYLMDGLLGEADKNGDGTVTLFEIGRYLEDAVPAAAAPQSQLPMVAGEKLAPLARVDMGALADWRTKKSSEKLALNTIGSRGLEQALLHDTDSLTQKRYADFNTALERRELLDAPPGHRSADDLFRQLSQNESLASLHSLMRRNLAVALQDEVQQALNALIDNDPYEANNWIFNPEKYIQYPAYLARTIELLGEGHYMAKSLRAKQLFFEGHNLARLVGDLENTPARRDSVREASKKLLLGSLALDGEAAYVPYAIGNLYQWNNPPLSDTVIQWYNRAVALAPTWLSPYLEAAHEFSWIDKYDAAEPWVMRAIAQDSSSYMVLERLAWLRQWQRRPHESLAVCDKMIALKPDLFNAYSTKERTLQKMLGDYEASVQYCEKSLAINPNQPGWAGVDLGLNYIYMRQNDKAVQYFKQALSKSMGLSDKNCNYVGLIQALVQSERYDEAEAAMLEARTIGFDSQNDVFFYQLQVGRMWMQRHQFEKAETALRSAFTVSPESDAFYVDYSFLLGEIKRMEGRADEAEGFFRKALAGKFTWTSYDIFDEIRLAYGRLLLSQHRDAEARAQFDQCGLLRPKGWRYAFGQALLAADAGKNTQALDWLEKALDRYLPRAAVILKEPLFAEIRKTKRFKEMMAKYFPAG